MSFDRRFARRCVGIPGFSVIAVLLAPVTSEAAAATCRGQDATLLGIDALRAVHYKRIRLRDTGGRGACTRGAVHIIEADLIRVGTREGMKVAKARGRLRGKQPKLTARQEAHLVQLHAAGDHTSAELAELFGVGRSTVQRAAAEQAESRAPSFAAGDTFLADTPRTEAWTPPMELCCFSSSANPSICDPRITS